MDNDQFDEVISYFTENINCVLKNISDTVKQDTYEIRLRTEKQVVLFGKYGSCFVKRDSTVSGIDSNYSVMLTGDDMREIISKICGYSVYTHQDDMTHGFVTFGSGHRAGFCGTAVRDDNKISALRDISSINIRIARFVDNAADELSEIFSGRNSFRGIIIAGAPCTGKTTLLRSFASKLSSEYSHGYMKTVIVDERGEMGMYSGFNCDIIKGYSKTEGIAHAIRVLSPEVVICDEVVSVDEAEKIIKACYSGVKFVVSVHVGALEELFLRPVSKVLTDSGFFDYAVFLEGSKNPGKIKKIAKTEELKNEFFCNNNSNPEHFFYSVLNDKQRNTALQKY